MKLEGSVSVKMGGGSGKLQFHGIAESHSYWFWKQRFSFLRVAVLYMCFYSFMTANNVLQGVLVMSEIKRLNRISNSLHFSVVS